MDHVLWTINTANALHNPQEMCPLIALFIVKYVNCNCPSFQFVKVSVGSLRKGLPVDRKVIGMYNVALVTQLLFFGNSFIWIPVEIFHLKG